MAKESKSKILREYLLREIFIDGRVVSYTQLKKMSEEFLKDEFSIGVLNGVLFKMEKKNELEKIERGKYRAYSLEELDVDIEKLIKEPLEEAIEKIQNRLTNVNVLELDDREFKLVKDIREFISESKSKFNIK